MNKGWFKDNWRHALAARGVKTSRYAYSGKGPLITDHEIYRIESGTGRDIGSMREHEIQHHVSNVRNAMANKNPNVQKPVEEKKKVDWLEPFRGPEEKSEIGIEIRTQHVEEKKREILQRMTMNGIPIEEQTRVMDHYGSGIIKRFMDGHMTQHEFDEQFESKIKHNVNGSIHKEEGDEHKFHSDTGEHGAFNFIDKASNSKGW